MRAESASHGQAAGDGTDQRQAKQGDAAGEERKVSHGGEGVAAAFQHSVPARVQQGRAEHGKKYGEVHRSRPASATAA